MSDNIPLAADVVRKCNMEVLGRVTMAQIARRAGVSRSAVSAAFTDQPTTVGLNPLTRAQIRKVAAELGYRPNILSRSFIKQRSYLISLLGNEAFFVYALEIIKGVEETVETTEYSILTFYNGDLAADQTKHLQKSITRRVDGMIILGAAERSDGPNRRLIKQMRSEGMPIVQIYRRLFKDVPAVAMDDEHAGYIATRHLIELGHRRIAHVTHLTYRDETFPGNDLEARQRSDGYLRAMKEAGIQPAIFTYERTGYYGLGSNDYAGYCAHAAKQLVSSDSRFTGIVTFNDYAAIGLIHNFREMGISVPDDISIVGYDNTEAGCLMRPSLTTIRPKLFDIGKLSGKMILEMMDGKKVEDIILQPELVVRGSTAAPKK